MIAIFQLLRPKQWIKNGFIALPLIFGGRALEMDLLVATVLAMGLFSMIASAIYALNDVVDVELDRAHPAKRHRPVARGAIAPSLALVLAGVLVVSGLLGTAWLSISALWPVLFYLIMNIAYTFWLKHVPLVDVFLIAIGFVLRVMVGGAVTGILLSPWLILLTFLLALMIALGKRRSELVTAGDQTPVRRSLRGYNLRFVDVAITLVASVSIVTYLMYALTPKYTTDHQMLLALGGAGFVMFGYLRYLQALYVDERAEDPTSLLFEDRIMQALVLGWIVINGLRIYVIG